MTAGRVSVAFCEGREFDSCLNISAGFLSVDDEHQGAVHPDQIERNHLKNEDTSCKEENNLKIPTEIKI